MYTTIWLLELKQSSSVFTVCDPQTSSTEIKNTSSWPQLHLDNCSNHCNLLKWGTLSLKLEIDIYKSV